VCPALIWHSSLRCFLYSEFGHALRQQKLHTCQSRRCRIDETLKLKHRVVHAPTTRLRAESDGSPSDMMIEYYRQCASDGGLIITESVHPSPDSFGVGPLKVEVRVSPSGTMGINLDSHPEATFGYFAEQLNELSIAYLHVIEPRVKGVETLEEGRPPLAAAHLRPIFRGTMIAAGGFDRSGAEAIIQAGDGDLVAFGRFFTSNPDLPYRLRENLFLTPYVRDAFWGGSEHNHNDFPEAQLV